MYLYLYPIFEFVTYFVKITRWMQLLKTSVRVFLCSKTEQKMYREPFLNLIFLILDTLFFPKLREKSTRIDEKVALKTNCSQRVKI